jgi:hypothetical protein
MTVGNATGRVKTISQDKWGRWSSQTFQGRAGTTLTIISAYQEAITAAAQSPHIRTRSRDIPKSGVQERFETLSASVPERRPRDSFSRQLQ